MPDFGETAGPFIDNFIHSIQEQTERLQPSVAEGFRDFEPSPQQITDFAEKYAERVMALGKVLADFAQISREGIEIPDDLSDLE